MLEKKKSFYLSKGSRYAVLDMNKESAEFILACWPNTNIYSKIHLTERKWISRVVQSGVHFTSQLQSKKQNIGDAVEF
jgi:hypothetical protein